MRVLPGDLVVLSEASKDPGEDGNPPGAWPNLVERFDMSDASAPTPGGVA